MKQNLKKLKEKNYELINKIDSQKSGNKVLKIQFEELRQKYEILTQQYKEVKNENNMFNKIYMFLKKL
mgnify:CR=1 FL=1